VGAVIHISCGTYVRAVVPVRDLYPLALACTTERMLPHVHSDVRLAELVEVRSISAKRILK
jgi:hypothetical protein